MYYEFGLTKRGKAIAELPEYQREMMQFIERIEFICLQSASLNKGASQINRDILREEIYDLVSLMYNINKSDIKKVLVNSEELISRILDRK